MADTVWCCHGDRYTVALSWWWIECGVTEIDKPKEMVEFQKIDLCLDTEEWLLLLVCSHSSEGSVFSQQCCTTWIFIWQNSKTGHYLAPYAATNPQSIDLHVKWETSNLPLNAWITVVQTEWDIFPDSAAKLWFMKDENNKLDFNKTGSFSLKKTQLGESSMRDWMWINYKSCIQCCNLWRFLPFQFLRALLQTILK